MLGRLDPRFLDEIIFPLGEQTKSDTRAEAEKAGLAVARRAESQEACFLAGDDYRSFLVRRGVDVTDGPVLDEEGNEVGRHSGYWQFTPGQRRGLGVAAPEPLYALRTEPTTNTLVVGPRASLARTTIDVSGRMYVPVDRGDVKLRYRSPSAIADIAAVDGGFRVHLDAPAYGVAAGQAAVVYEDDAVVGAGLIRT